MDASLEILELVLGGAFLVLALVCFAQGRRNDDRTRPLAALSFALMALTMILTFVGPSTDYRFRFLAPFALLAFIASGFPLMLFRRALLGGVERLSRALPLALAFVGAGMVLADFPYDESSELNTGQYSLLMTGALLWSVCVGEPAIAFWRTARKRPAVQRARLRALSVGCVGLIVVAVTWSATSGTERSALLLAIHVLALLMIPVLYISFSPPRWLRRSWREKEATILFAAQELAVFYPDERTLAEHALMWALRLVGTETGWISDAGGTVLASRAAPAARQDPSSGGPTEVSVPLEYGGGQGELVIVPDPLTPVFGTDEVERLVAFGSVVAVALDRVRLVAAVARENERYERLLQAVSDLDEGVVVTDQGRLLYANDAYTRMTGYTIDELKALPSLMELTVPEERLAIEKRLRSRLAGEEVEDHYEARLVHKDGHIVDVESAVKLVRTSEGLQIVSVIRDITERKEHERKLRELDAMRSEFIGNAAHELRTPLTPIVGLAATLARSRAKMSDVDLEACIEGLDRGARRLANLVNRLLDFTQLDRGGLHVDIQRVELDLIAFQVMETSPAPAGIRVRVDIPHGVVVWADPVRIEQIFSNLLMNAYRYGGKEISLRAETAGDEVLVEVADDGPGIPASLLDQLFDPFVRGSNDQEGAGLGLAIVRRLVEAFGGTIAYHPAEPHGARFQVRLRGAVSAKGRDAVPQRGAA